MNYLTIIKNFSRRIKFTKKYSYVYRIIADEIINIGAVTLEYLSIVQGIQ